MKSTIDVFQSVRKTIAAAVLFLGMTLAVRGQNLTVSGSVTDPSGQPVIGASVFVTGTQNGTVTNEMGQYSLSRVPSGATLQFSCIGYKTVDETVAGRQRIDVILEEENEMLDEMVVIGYGTVKKKDLTGAVSVVKPEEFQNKTNTSIGDLLQGAASGVSVRSTGEIGGVPSIQIRGTGNLTNNDPLYVIDGMPTNNDINFNVNDIESIQILKDASAAAIYGSRAANGVVIITTKSGQESQTKFEFNTQIAVQNLKRISMAGAEEWKKYYDEAIDNAIAEGIEGVTKRMDHWNNDTDWQKAYFKTGISQNYDLSMSGGTKTGKYRTSFNYMNNSGTTIKRRLERYTLRVNSSGKLGIFTIGENMSIGRTYIRNAGGGALRKVGGSIADVVRMVPTIAVRDEVNGNEGGWGIGNEAHARALGANPVAQSNDRDRWTNVLFARGTAYAEANIFPWLKYKLNLGVDVNANVTNSWTSGYSVALNSASGSSSATESNSRTSTYLVENTLSLDKTFGKHHVDAIVGTTYQLTDYQTSSASQQGLIQTASGEFLTTVSAGTESASVSGTRYSAALISYLGRINYDFDGRYLLSLTGRIDGSSRFASDYRWGTFPSVSAAWRISKEPFFHVNWIDDLKLRANWGNLGSQNVGYYDYQMYINNYAQYLFSGGSGEITHGQTMVKLSNQNLTWERLEQTNIGLDLGVLGNRLQMSAEWYRSTSHDVLTALELLMTTGNGGGNPYVNAASIQNQGFELTASWRDQVNKDFSYSIGANVSHADNKLLDFGYGKEKQNTDYTITMKGEPIGMFYMIETLGIFQSQDEVNAYVGKNGPIQPTAKPGDLKYKDANGDGTITPADREVAGSPWPKFELGLNLSAKYRNFDFGLIGFGKFGQKAFNFNRWYQEGFQDCNSAPENYDYWTPANTGAKNPRLLYADERNVYTWITRWLEDASFFKFSSLSVGYTLAPKALKKYFDSIHFTVSGQNLFSLTKYSGYDPDFQGTLFEPGMDFCTYPSPRSVIFTVNVKF